MHGGISQKGSSVSDNIPVQLSPPYIGEGFVHVLCLLRLVLAEIPHVLEQGTTDHTVQLDQPPRTVEKTKCVNTSDTAFPIRMKNLR